MSAVMCSMSQTGSGPLAVWASKIQAGSSGCGPASAGPSRLGSGARIRVWPAFPPAKRAAVERCSGEDHPHSALDLACSGCNQLCLRLFKLSVRQDAAAVKIRKLTQLGSERTSIDSVLTVPRRVDIALLGCASRCGNHRLLRSRRRGDPAWTCLRFFPLLFFEELFPVRGQLVSAVARSFTGVDPSVAPWAIGMRLVRVGHLPALAFLEVRGLVRGPTRRCSAGRVSARRTPRHC